MDRGLVIHSKVSRLMASVMTSEFVETSKRAEVPPFSLIEQKGLIARLIEEIARASSELAHDPRGFISDLLTDETRDRRRQRRMRLLLAGALLFHAALLAVIIIAGWRAISADDKPDLVVKGWVKPDSSGSIINAPDEPKPEPSGGGKSGGGDPGGGGQNDPRPVNQGTPPPQVPNPVLAKFAPPDAQPLLSVPQAIQGPTTAPPPTDATIGLPDGVLGAPPSPGPGGGGGIGPGEGPGAGPGRGPTAGTTGSGSGKGPGSGDPSGGLGGRGSIDWNRLKDHPGNTPIQWIRRIRAITTPEAQANKVSGEVVFRATFTADGTITNIQLISTVPYMAEAAEEALRNSTFRPATINGVAITVRNVIVRIRVGIEGGQ